LARRQEFQIHCNNFFGKDRQYPEMHKYTATLTAILNFPSYQFLPANGISLPQEVIYVNI
jgi:hypothetical protein